jgi:translation initiation factor 3 subunit G
MEKKVDDPDNPGYTITIKEVRGFAYISFYVRNEAEAAMGALQGHGYDHLILRLEWANPQAPRPDGGGRESPRFRSGYGEKLAQDSTLKVSYASNLTENR